MKLLIAIPTRGRKIADWLPRYLELSTHTETIFHVALDQDDPRLVESVAYMKGLDTSKVYYSIGPSQGKIPAINRAMAYRDHEWDLAFQASDDLVMLEEGYDSIMVEDMKRYFPELNGILWYDLDNQHEFFKTSKGSQLFLRRAICIAPVVGSAYYHGRLKGRLYHEEYKSFFCDQELAEIAKKDMAITYIQNKLGSHTHPSWEGGMTEDDTYRRANRNWAHDEELFIARNGHVLAGRR